MMMMMMISLFGQLEEFILTTYQWWGVETPPEGPLRRASAVVYFDISQLKLVKQAHHHHYHHHYHHHHHQYLFDAPLRGRLQPKLAKWAHSHHRHHLRRARRIRIDRVCFHIPHVCVLWRRMSLRTGMRMGTPSWASTTSNGWRAWTCSASSCSPWA
jgi:hypothetical protein